MSPDARIPPEVLERIALRAFLLWLGFHLLAAVIAVPLLLFVSRELVYQGRFSLPSFLALGVAILVITMVRPRRDTKNPPLPVMTPSDQPRLFEKVHEVASLAGRPLPAHMHLISDFKLLDVPDGFLGLNGKRRMGIGLPFFVLEVSELCAVIAHEYGHYHTSSWLIRWLYTARFSIVHTLSSLEKHPAPWTLGPYKYYARTFLRLTHNAARQIEYDADAFAVAVVGAPALVSAMQKIEACTPLERMQRATLINPALAMGYRVPLLEGLYMAASDPDMRRAGDDYIQRLMATVAPEHLFQPHPSMRDRIRAIESLEQEPAMAPDSRPASVLLDDIPQLEADLYAITMPHPERLPRIGWDEVGSKVIIAKWTRTREMNHAVLQGWNVERVPEFVQLMLSRPANVKSHDHKPLPPEQLRATIFEMVSSCLALLLVDKGWVVIASPVEGINLERPDGTKPEIDLATFSFQNEGEAELWRRGCDEAGITRMPLLGRARAVSGETTSA